MFKKIIVLLILLVPVLSFANNGGVFKGVVTNVISEKVEVIPGTRSEAIFQELEINIFDEKGDTSNIRLENDYIKLRVGDRIFLEKIVDFDGTENFIVREKDRTYGLLLFFFVFIFSIIVFGGRQGVRSILSLFFSLFVVVYVLVPLILKGYSPVVVSSIIATVILFVAIYFTHGINRESTSAFLGTVISVLITGFLSYLCLQIFRFTGLSSDEAMMLSLHGDAIIDFKGLLLGGIIIGALGVLDDVAITQSVVVRQIYDIGKDMTPAEVYKRAISVGKDHVGAMVNTLALAYTGVSLPLILIFYNSSYPISLILSQEMISVEITRTILGSIGLVLSVPITTLFATFLLRRKSNFFQK